MPSAKKMQNAVSRPLQKGSSVATNPSNLKLPFYTIGGS